MRGRMKKVFFALAVFIMLSSVSAQNIPDECYLNALSTVGDINTNGNIDLTDAVYNNYLNFINLS